MENIFCWFLKYGLQLKALVHFYSKDVFLRVPQIYEEVKSEIQENLCKAEGVEISGVHFILAWLYLFIMVLA